ncbi:MAG TPA: S8 family serine peptidase [Solirubrobacteraceae bacterium]
MAHSPPIPRVLRRLLKAGAGAILLGVAAPAAAAVGFPAFSPHVVVVRFARHASPVARAADLRGSGSLDAGPMTASTRRLRLARGVSVARALRLLRRSPGVVWAEPDYIAHAADFPTPSSDPTLVPQVAPTSPPFLPNDPGRLGPGGWAQLQWNFAGPFGVNAPEAWSNLIADGHPGGQGVIVAVLDTGVAYANRGRFHRSPDFTAAQFVRGYDFVNRNQYPNDDNGHGTQVAGTIAERTDNGIGLTGLAYGVRIMPVRVLDGRGDGDASAIADGVVFAVRHHAQIINLSLEFTSDVTAASVPVLADALSFAHARGVLVVSAAGNEGTSRIAYPARAPYVVAVGASTEHGCPADFSNHGHGLDILAPGGGDDARLPRAEDPNCMPEGPSGADIYQETLIGGSPRRFGLPSGYEGTSMATPHVSAAAALVIASGVLGPHPSAQAIVARLKATARPLGPAADTARFGAGLLDAGAATLPGGPGAIAAGGSPPATGVLSTAPSASA